MPPAADQQDLRLGVIHVAVHHPQRVWVDILASQLNSRWDVEVVAAHTDRGWVDHAVLTDRVDVLLLHLDDTGEELAATTARLQEASPALKVVALSDSSDPSVIVSAVRAGVRGWVPPSATVDHLVAVLHGVARSETWLPPAVLTAVLDTILTEREARTTSSTALDALSARELDVLCCLVQGLSRQQIAERYVLSSHTVRTHITNLLRKLNVHSTLAAVSLAREAGLSEPRRTS
jgi:DNA-binding NarL/FixJ family response regulator